MTKRELRIALPIPSKGEVRGVFIATRTENRLFERKDVASLERVCLNFDSPLLDDIVESVGTLIGKDRIVERSRVH
jgi:hypothetical protein